MDKKIIDCQSALDWLCQKYLMDGYKPGQEPNENGNGRGQATDLRILTDVELLERFPMPVRELDENEVRRALSFIPPVDREIWMDKIGFALKSAVIDGLLPEDVAFKLWDEWSQKSSDKYDASEMQGEWNGITPDGRIHINTLFWIAQKHGYKRNYRLTENGNAERFADLNRGRLRWYPPTKKWMYYDGIRWAIDNGEIALGFGRELANNLYKELADCKEEFKEKFAKHVFASNSAKAINAMIALAKSDLVINTDELDCDQYKLNVLNGTLDLKTGQLLPHCADDFITKLAPVQFDPAAKAPQFNKFLFEIFDSRGGLIKFILCWFGYCLTGDVKEQKLIFHHGSGSNGKSVLLKLLLKMMGNYAQQFSSDLLLKRKNVGAANEELFNLIGNRLASTIELNRGVKLDEALLKWATGADMMAARALFGHLVQFMPTHKINVAVNDLPYLSESDAVWRRILKAPYDVKFVDEPEKDPDFSTGKVCKKDPDILDKLLTETSGILNSLIKGCLHWQRNGLPEPEEVKQATADYRESMDVVKLFVEACCVIAEKEKVSASDLHRAFLKFARDNSMSELTIGELKDRLMKRGFQQTRKKTGMVWHGISLQVDDFFDMAGSSSAVD